MGQIYIVASGKGGVGKTTVTANTAACLAACKNRVLCFDADLSLRNFDILMNKQDEAVFDIQDIFLKRCDFEKALLTHDDIPDLSFIPAPTELQVSENELCKFILQLAKEKTEEFDFIFIDCPAGLSAVENVMDKDAVFLLVATPDEASVRSAERAAEVALDAGAVSRLIVNRIRPDFIKKGLAPNIDEIIDDTAVRLIGLVPEDEEVLLAAAKNSLLCLKKRGEAKKAFENIAARLCGATVPLLKLK